MTENENFGRRLQRKARDTARQLSQDFENSEIKKVTKSKADEIATAGRRKYTETGVDKFVQQGSDKAKSSFDAVKNTAKAIDEKAGISEGAKTTKEKVKTHVYAPAKSYLDDKGVTGSLATAAGVTGNIYGDVRTIIKPYFDPEDARELLTNTNKQLTAITACILQISRKDAEGWMGSFGKLVTAKVAGVTGTVTLFSLVSTFGTAGTGTAISTLSGAAANSATLAALGLGGGMATGALVLAGFGAVVGVVTYKIISSNPRDFDTLPKEDKQIVETCGVLAAAIQERLNDDPLELSAHEALQFRAALEKLHSYLKENTERVCGRLDTKNAVIYRRHILKDFEPAVLKAYKSYASKAPFSATGTIGGVFYALLTRTAIDGSLEQELVLEALRRSNNDLHDASEIELSDYLDSKTPEQLQGVANNVKGIYHELMWVETYNANNQDTYAKLHEATSHQGSDVMIKSSQTDEVLSEYQLKATNSESYVREHQQRYKDIELKATDEVASKMDGVETSEFSNAELTENVEVVFVNVSDNTFGDRVLESAQYTGLAAAGFEAINVLRGKSDLSNAGKSTLRAASSAAAATGITAFLFG